MAPRSAKARSKVMRRASAARQVAKSQASAQIFGEEVLVGGLAKNGIDVDWFVEKYNPIVVKELFVDGPRFGPWEGLAVHGGGCRHEAEQSQLRDTNEGDLAGFAIPPCAGGLGVRVFRRGEGEPDVDVGASRGYGNSMRS